MSKEDLILKRLSKLDGVERRLGNLVKQIDGFEKKLDSLDIKLSCFEKRLDSIEEILETHGRLLTKLIQMFGVHDQRLNSVGENAVFLESKIVSNEVKLACAKENFSVLGRRL